MTRIKGSMAKNDLGSDRASTPGSISALFTGASEAEAAIAELHLRGFASDSINVSVHAWSSEGEAPAEELDDVPVVFDPAIPPDEPMGGGRILGIGERQPRSEDEIARAADTLSSPMMESTARLTVRVDDDRKDLVRTILEAHGGALEG
jgi:hypothetical protein